MPRSIPPEQRAKISAGGDKKQITGWRKRFWVEHMDDAEYECDLVYDNGRLYTENWTRDGVEVFQPAWAIGIEEVLEPLA